MYNNDICSEIDLFRLLNTFYFNYYPLKNKNRYSAQFIFSLMLTYVL